MKNSGMKLLERNIWGNMGGVRGGKLRIDVITLYCMHTEILIHKKL